MDKVNLGYKSLLREVALLKKRIKDLDEVKNSYERAKIEVEKKNNELLKLDSLKTEFITTISHELRTPLTAISEGISQVIEGILGETNQKQREFLNVSLENVERLKTLINDLLNLSGLEGGKPWMEVERTDLIGIVREVIAQLRGKVISKGLIIKENFSWNGIYIDADKEKITHVFSHLINNAINYTDKGYIEVSIEDNGSRVDCAIIDTGIGISKEEIPKIFDKFHQLGRSPGGGYKGAGLGLAIVKGIIEVHKGVVGLESEEGKGSKFTFSIPKINK